MKTKPVEKRGGVLVEPGAREAQLPVPARATATPESPVFQLKEILVPVDFTECTEKALSYAVPFARQFGATLTLLHVLEPTYVPAAEISVVAEFDTEEEVKREMEKTRARLAGQVRCETLIRKGSAEFEIIKAAKERACDLIILGTHGRTGMDRLLLGSTAEKVVRRAGCPIFVVRPHEHDFIPSPPADDQPGDPEGLETEMEAEMRAGV